METFLSDIRAVLDECKPPYCFGTFSPSTERDLLLYYSSDSDKCVAGRVDFNEATDSDLKKLACACKPATFGRDNVDVLDPTYRKALKLDNIYFAIGFNVYGESDVLDKVKFALLEGHDAKKELRAELYKLNIYEEEAFFKPHKDTPRSEKMIGSLVLVYPTSHEGGALALRHGGKEWVFDSGKVLSNTVQPSIAYVAFFSDVEHEVLPVQKGYRVTITYNLYVDDDDDDDSTQGSGTNESVGGGTQEQVSLIQNAIRTQLDNAQFLPEGGILAFALFHEYPVTIKGVAAISSSYLKGRDAILYAACQDLGLCTRTTFWYNRYGGDYGFEFIGDRLGLDDEMYDDDSSLISDAKRAGAQLVKHEVEESDSWFLDQVGRNLRPFIWVIDPQERNRVKEQYINYGNEPQICYYYGEGCLVVEIGGPENRIVTPSGKLSK